MCHNLNFPLDYIRLMLFVALAVAVYAWASVKEAHYISNNPNYTRVRSVLSDVSLWVRFEMRKQPLWMEICHRPTEIWQEPAESEQRDEQERKPEREMSSEHSVVIRF